MRALQLTDWNRLEVVQIEDPPLEPGQTRIQVLATGICGSDLHGYTGENGRRVPGQIMGHETVGVVIEKGSDLGNGHIAVGTLVAVNPVTGCGNCPRCARGNAQLCPRRSVLGVDPSRPAAFAEHLVLPTANAVEFTAVRAPDLGALVEPLAVGHHAVVRGGCRPSDAVLIIGGGPIGQACAVAARRAGVTDFVVSEPSDTRRRLVEQLGFATIDPRSDSFDQHLVVGLGRAPETVIDAVGSDSSVQTALRVSDVAARIVVVGMAQPELTFSAYRLSTDERTLVGSFCYTAAEFASTADFVAENTAWLRPLIDGHVDLDGAPDAFRDLARGTSSASKILVHPNGVENR